MEGKIKLMNSIVKAVDSIGDWGYTESQRINIYKVVFNILTDDGCLDNYTVSNKSIKFHLNNINSVILENLVCVLEKMTCVNEYIEKQETEREKLINNFRASVDTFDALNELDEYISAVEGSEFTTKINIGETTKFQEEKAYSPNIVKGKNSLLYDFDDFNDLKKESSDTSGNKDLGEDNFSSKSHLRRINSKTSIENTDGDEICSIFSDGENYYSNDSGSEELNNYSESELNEESDGDYANRRDDDDLFGDDLFEED